MQIPLMEVRRRNLCLLIDKYGTIADLNRKVGRKEKDATFSIIKNQIKGRGCGNIVARSLEEKLSLPHGWMDEPHGVGDVDFKNPEIVKVREMANYASCGQGAMALEQDVIAGDIGLNKNFLRRFHFTDASKLSVITGYGDSMSPTIESGDKVLVDEGIKDYNQGGIFVIRAGGMYFIKRISVLLNGTAQISSDNPSVHLAEVLTEESEIIGKVIYIWHGRAV